MSDDATKQAIQDVLDFWHAPGMDKQWFQSTPALDKRIRDDYEALHAKAAAGGLRDWLDSAEGCLGLAIVLDQFPLNMYRGEARSFASEDKAVAVSLHAIERGFDEQLPAERRMFLYMPLMHSENMAHQDLSVEKFTALGVEESARFARHHRGIVARFGRFPHRNAILGRKSAAEELAWLQTDEAFKG